MATKRSTAAPQELTFTANECFEVSRIGTDYPPTNGNRYIYTGNGVVYVHRLYAGAGAKAHYQVTNALIGFELPTLPPGAVIESATVRVWGAHNTNINNQAPFILVADYHDWGDSDALLKDPLAVQRHHNENIVPDAVVHFDIGAKIPLAMDDVHSIDIPLANVTKITRPRCRLRFGIARFPNNEPAKQVTEVQLVHNFPRHPMPQLIVRYELAAAVETPPATETWAQQVERRLSMMESLAANLFPAESLERRLAAMESLVANLRPADGTHEHTDSRLAAIEKKVFGYIR